MLSGVNLYDLGRTIEMAPDVDRDELSKGLVVYTAERSAEIAGLMLEIGLPSNDPYDGPIMGSIRTGGVNVELTCEIVDTTVNLDNRSDVILSIRASSAHQIDNLSLALTGHPNRALYVMYWAFETPTDEYANDHNNTVLPLIAHVDVEACKAAGVHEHVIARALLTNAYFGIHHS